LSFEKFQGRLLTCQAAISRAIPKNPSLDN
jgi:hypothetical protein